MALGARHRLLQSESERVTCVYGRLVDKAERKDAAPASRFSYFNSPVFRTPAYSELTKFTPIFSHI